MGLLRGLLRSGRPVAGVNGVLIGFIRLGRSELDSLLRPGIRVLDRLAVGSRELIQFVDAVADGSSLPLDVLFAGKRVQFAPETFMRVRLQRSLAGRVVNPGSSGLVGRSALGCGLSLGGGTLLRECGENQASSQQQRDDDPILHFELPPSGSATLLLARLTARL